MSGWAVALGLLSCRVTACRGCVLEEVSVGLVSGRATVREPSRTLCLFENCVFYGAIRYYKRSVVDSRKFERYVYLRKAIVSPLFQMCLFHKTTHSNFCWRSSVVNARKHLQSSHSFKVNLLIWQFGINCSYSLRIVSFLEEQL